MASQAAKKAQRASRDLSKKLKNWIFPINILYFFYRIIWQYSSATNWNLVGYVFLTGITYMTFSWIIAAAEEGGSSEYAMDILLITLFVQAGLIISDYFWFVYLVIPGYGLYLCGGMILRYVFTPDPVAHDDPAAQKRKEKAERKASRQKIRYR